LQGRLTNSTRQSFAKFLVAKQSIADFTFAIYITDSFIAFE
jgi:hypothetical protein